MLQQYSLTLARSVSVFRRLIWAFDELPTLPTTASACLLVFLWTGLAPVYAATTLRYGGDHAFAPFESIDDKGVPRGFQIDLLRAIEKTADVKVEIRLGPWPATEAAFRAGEVDFIAMTATRARRSWALFARKHATPATGIYHLAGSRSPLALDELAGKRLAIDATNEAMLHTRETFLPGERYLFIPKDSARAALEAVATGEADFALMSRAYGDALLAQGMAPKLQRARLSPLLQAYGFAVAPGNEALRGQLEGWLDTLEQNGTLDNLRKKWLASDQDAAVQARMEKKVSTLGFNLAGTALFAMVGFVLLWWLVQRRTRRWAAERALRIKREKELHLARIKLEHAFSAHPDGMLITNDHGVPLEANDAFCRMFGKQRAHLDGAALQSLFGEFLGTLSQSNNLSCMTALRELLRTRNAFDGLPLERLVGGTDASPAQTQFLMLSGRCVEFAGELQAVLLIRDVTRQMQNDATLRAEFNALAAETQAQARALESELESARIEAKQKGQTLEEFIAAAAHDLRAPLRVVKGFASILREDLEDGNVASAVDSANRIEDAVGRMDSILDGLLRLAHAGEGLTSHVEVDMTATARQAWATVCGAAAQVAQTTASRQADKAALRRPAFMVDQLPPAVADPAMVAQIWQNLLDNARKYSGHTDGAKVRIDHFSEGGRNWYRVTDNGAGFDMKRADQLFRPFRRFHTAAQFPGSGIGLSIVRRIVEAHGGEIRARSNPGVGTVIEFNLGAGLKPAK